MANGLRDLTWDSASCVRIVIGSTRVVLTKFGLPKVETKTEKPPRIGEARATKRTPGRTEIADVAGEILLTDWTSQILPVMNRHGGNLLQFPIIASVSHPSIAGSYDAMLDDCRIVSQEGPEFDGSEKALMKKLGFSVMQAWERGADGVWKCSSFEAALPSSQARALMQF
jgi:hypothetical protein